MQGLRAAAGDRSVTESLVLCNRLQQCVCARFLLALAHRWLDTWLDDPILLILQEYENSTHWNATIVEPPRHPDWANPEWPSLTRTGFGCAGGRSAEKWSTIPRFSCSSSYATWGSSTQDTSFRFRTLHLLLHSYVNVCSYLEQMWLLTTTRVVMSLTNNNN